MAKKITITLSDDAEKVFNEIMYSLPKNADGSGTCSQSDAINYALYAVGVFETHVGCDVFTFIAMMEEANKPENDLKTNPMSNYKHTPGPWSQAGEIQRLMVSGHPHKAWLVANHDTGVAVVIIPHEDLTDEVGVYAEANAKLIAAAPDMLEALVGLNEAIDAYWNGKKTDAQVKKICAVQRRCFEIITKATT